MSNSGNWRLVLLSAGALLAVLIRHSGAMISSASLPQGYTLSEGDILVPQSPGHAMVQRKIVKKGVSRWARTSEGLLVVPYVITEGVNAFLVRKALSHWQDLTCIQFEEYGSEEEAPKPFVRYRTSQDLCGSSVGVINDTAQNDIFLSKFCPIQSVIHETGHRLGFIHEQSRSDRNDHINIVYDNIIDGLQKNFLIYDMTLNYSVPYDFSSIMHYDTMAFSNGKGPTILTLNPLYQEILGEHYSHGGLSFMDAKVFNVGYGCIGDWEKACAGVMAGPCLHEGYTIVKKGACCCACPLGTEGRRCEVKNLNYNDALLKYLSPLSGVITKPSIIDTKQARRHVRGYYWPEGVRFTKVITAPACHQVLLTVTTAKMVKRLEKGGCRTEYVQIRLTNSTHDAGQTFCGLELMPGQSFSSKGQSMVVHVRSAGRGHFAAQVTFNRVQDCFI